MVGSMMDKMLLSLIGDKWAGLNKKNLQIETKSSGGFELLICGLQDC